MLALAHCQVVPVTGASESVRLAVSSELARGRFVDRVTDPPSSSSVTVMVTVTSPVALDESVAVTVTV